MNYLMKKAVNLNGQDMMLAPLDIDFAHRTISLTGEIDEDVATVMNSSLRCLARDSDDDNLVAYTPPEYFSRESDVMDALAIAEESLVVMEAELREIEKSKTNTEEYPGQLTIWDIPYAETELLAPYTEELKTAA